MAVTYFACGIFGHGLDEQQAREDWKVRVSKILEALHNWYLLPPDCDVESNFLAQTRLFELYTLYSDHRSEKDIACQSLQQMQSKKEALTTSLNESGAQQVTFDDAPYLPPEKWTEPEGPQG